MTNQEYIDRLEQIESAIIKKTASEDKIDAVMQQLYCYKPVAMYWYYVCALKEYEFHKNLQAPYEMLEGKYVLYLEQKGIMKLFDLYSRIQKQCGNGLEVGRMNYIKRALYNDYTSLLEAEEAYKKANALPDNEELDFAAYYALFGVQDLLAYRIHWAARRVRFPAIVPRGELEWVNNCANFGYLFMLLQEKDATVFLFAQEDNKNLMELMSRDLQDLGLEVYLFSEIEGDEGELTEIRQLADDIIYSTKHPILFLGEASFLSELEVDVRFNRKMIRLYNDGAFIAGKNMALCYYGDYCDYISKIYLEDSRSLIQRTATKRFSIVIPARNSSATLRYTLQTCLEQTYDGDYEIIISDNSTGQNTAVYELCKELNDERIVYLKTPRNLHLPKSFEYAYLHAAGEYIFAIGSDDGLLPWALSILDKEIRTHPEEEVIQWERGFYAWPGFNGGQQHEFRIPKAYKKGQSRTYYKDGIDYLAEMMIRPEAMYGLPMLYINSCFRRSYYQTLLDKTGRLWDGVCQDVYMGVITAAINERVFNIEYPLTIAGMSDRSIGANSSKGIYSDEKLAKLVQQQQADGNMGAYWRSPYERFVPSTGTDTFSLFTSFMRAISIGVLPESYLTEVFDWKKMFRRLADELDIRDVAFDRKIHEMRYAAMQHGEDFLEWFDKVIYNPMLEPHMLDEGHLYQAEQRKTYTNHRTENGGMVLDASEYGVENVHDAVQLFVRLSELG